MVTCIRPPLPANMWLPFEGGGKFTMQKLTVFKWPADLSSFCARVQLQHYARVVTTEWVVRRQLYDFTKSLTLQFIQISITLTS